MSLTFAYPWVLTLLLAIPLLAWLKGKRGRQSAFLYSSIQLVRGMANLNRSSVGSMLLRLRWLSLVLLIIAVAQPRLPEGEAKINASGIDIVICLDLSTSMAAEDFELHGNPVNRLEIAKDVIHKFVEKRTSDRIGLVAFAGKAYIAAPITLDHDVLLQNLDRLELGTIEDGTAIGSGISAAVNRVRELKSKSRIVILMTDGQNNAGKVPPLAAAEAAEALKVKIYTIGVGTRGTAYVPYVNAFGQRARTTQKVDIDEDTLTKVAARTGAKYYRADNTAALRNIYDEIDQLERTDAAVKKFQQYRELFPWFVLGGLMIFLLEIILGNTVWRRLP